MDIAKIGQLWGRNRRTVILWTPFVLLGVYVGIKVWATSVSHNPAPESPAKIVSEHSFVNTGKLVLLESDRTLWVIPNQTSIARQWEEEHPGEFLFNCDHGVADVLRCEVFKREGG